MLNKNQSMHRFLQITFTLIFFIASYIAIGSIAKLYTANSTVYKVFQYSPTLKLGLDINGGSQLILRVDFQKFLNNKYNSIARDIGILLTSNNLGVSNLTSNANGIMMHNFSPNPEILTRMTQLIKNISEDLNIIKNHSGITIQYSAAYNQEMLSKIINKSINIIRNRLDGLGTNDVMLQKVGTDGIILEMPGISDPSFVKNALGNVAKLSFHLMDSNEPFLDEMPSYQNDDMEIMHSFYQDKNLVYYQVNKNIEIHGDSIIDARVSVDQFKPSVVFRLNDAGTKQFALISSNNIGKPFAVVMDDKVLTAPVIAEPILNGSCSITGHFSYADAQNLANMIRSGALPAPIEITGERVVGPTLGGDTMQSAQNAFLMGVGLIFVFMILYYQALGIIANIAILYNLVLVVSIMAIFNIALTLPGIAGLILMLGMAVDANVLIYERMRDECINGVRDQQQIIRNGFRGSLTAIVDSNITTILSVASLMSISSGFIRGFAITLIYGILCSLFTSIFVTKIIMKTLANFVHIIRPSQFIRAVI